MQQMKNHCTSWQAQQQLISFFTGYNIQGIQDTKDLDIRSLNHGTTVILDNSYGEGIRHELYIKYMLKVVSPNIPGAQ